MKNKNWLPTPWSRRTTFVDGVLNVIKRSWITRAGGGWQGGKGEKGLEDPSQRSCLHACKEPRGEELRNQTTNQEKMGNARRGDFCSFFSLSTQVKLAPLLF